MSILTEDFIPFDYMRYGTEILPAIEQATRGDAASLYNLIGSATHFSPILRSKYALPASEKLIDILWLFEGLFDAATLRRIKAGEAWDPWQALATVVPTLEGRSLRNLGRFGDLLIFHLFATFCCEPPPWSVKRRDPYRRPEIQWYEGALFWHEEISYAWNAYCCRDEETKALWGAFRQPAPPDLIELLRLKDISENQYAPRSMPIYTEAEKEMSITGFMTLEEIQRLLANVRIHERPVLKVLLDEDGNFETFSEAYLESLHKLEDEILHRMRFAAERGWGMLNMHAKL